MLRFSCPNCRAGLKLAAESAVRVVNCPKCRTPIRVTAPTREPAEDDDADDDPEVPRKRRRRKRSSSGVPPLLWVALALGVLFRLLDTIGVTAQFNDVMDVSRQELEWIKTKVYLYLGLRWVVAVVVWAAVFFRSNSGRRIMIGLCWLTLVGFALVYAVHAGDPVGAKEFSRELPIIAIASVVTLAIAFLLGQESVKRYTRD